MLTWNLAPSYNDAAFVFDPPADAQKIVFAEEKSNHPQGATRSYPMKIIRPFLSIALSLLLTVPSFAANARRRWS